MKNQDSAVKSVVISKTNTNPKSSHASSTLPTFKRKRRKSMSRKQRNSQNVFQSDVAPHAKKDTLLSRELGIAREAHQKPAARQLVIPVEYDSCQNRRSPVLMHLSGCSSALKQSQ